MKRFWGICIVLIGAILVFGLYLRSLTLAPAPQDKNLVEFEITRGESTAQIGDALEKAGLIKSALMFRVVVRETGLGGKLQAGIYQLSPALSLGDLANSLTRGTAKAEKFTIPEGFRLEQIADLAATELSIPRASFLAAAKGMEGQLFPDTYFVGEGTDAKGLVDLMHANFVKKVGDIDTKTLILASLVERETRGVPEKPIVAGILEKRLAAGWPLELDATIQYALGTSKNWWPDTTLLDRKTHSRYNTYLNPGLPPTPICNPGLEAINAVRNATTSPYWFYLHDQSGTIHYATTSAEQNANIATYLK